MTFDPSVWRPWLQPAAGLATLQWSLLLAAAAVTGYLLHHRLRLPKVLGYALVGTLAGWWGWGAATWPLQGSARFVLELGVAIVLFECGSRITWRWFRHNPMVLVQSVLEAALTYGAVFLGLRGLGIPPTTATPLALIAIAASPVVLARVIHDTRAEGPVSDRSMALATLSTLYALVLGGAYAQFLAPANAPLWQHLLPWLAMLCVSMMVAAVLCLCMHLALHWMCPSSENTAVLMLALVAMAAAIATPLGGSAPLAAVLAGMLLKQLHPRPWIGSRQLGTASSLLTMLMFVLVSSVAAQAPWSAHVAAAVSVLVLARLGAKAMGVGLGHIGSGASWRQAVWVACAMTPMSAVALLLAAYFAHTDTAAAHAISHTALPAILLLELLGAVAATWALRRAGEAQSTLPPPSQT